MDMDNNTQNTDNNTSNVDNNTPKKSSTPTICLIFTLIIIFCFGFLTYKLYKEKKDADDKIETLNKQITELKENTSNSSDKVDNNAEENSNVSENNISNSNSNVSENNTSNSNSNVNTDIKCPTCTTSNSMTEISYRHVVSIDNGVPYVIPIYQNDGFDFETYKFYFNHKFEVNDIKSGVKKVQSFGLGLDPSGIREYFVMENGSVRILEENLSKEKESVTFTTKELAPSSNNIETLEFTKGVVYGVSKSGNKVKIDEVDKSIKEYFKN